MITVVSVSMAASGALAAPGENHANWQAKFKHDMEQCWNQEEAAGVVTLRFEMSRGGTVIEESIRAIPRDMNGTESFMAAKRAVLKCSQNGFNLPPDQFDVWSHIQMTFKPDGDWEQ